VRARTALEASKPAGFDEVLLVAPGGGLLEGTQTNFFAVQGGRVLTAGGADVLGGSVRRLVLEVCAAEGIPVDASAPPLLRDARAWSGAFLTSTSRLVLPVDALAYKHDAVVEGGGGNEPAGASPLVEVAIPSASDALVALLERLVADAVAEHSVPLPV
jgi:thiol oxidase